MRVSLAPPTTWAARSDKTAVPPAKLKGSRSGFPSEGGAGLLGSLDLFVPWSRIVEVPAPR